MPRPRLPWYKVWVGTARHRKVVPLSDRSFRVWHEMMDAASEQKIRGRFDSLAVAAQIIRRKLSEVRPLVEAGLVDVADDGVWMHDWKDWQRWRPEDAQPNDADTPPEDHTNDPRNGSGITHEKHRNGTGISGIEHVKKQPLARAREDVDVEGEEDRDVDVETRLKTNTPPKPPRGRPPNKSAVVIDAFRALGIDVILSGRDHGAIKACNAPPELIAECYHAVATRQYPQSKERQDYMLGMLSVHAVVDWINGYVIWRDRGLRREVRVAETDSSQCELCGEATSVMARGMWLCPACDSAERKRDSA